MPDQRDYFHQCRAWVTGASTGIGRALVLELVRRGARVAVSSRQPEGLDSLARECGEWTIFPIPLDVTNRDENLKAAQAIRAALGGLDLAIFNAGTCEFVDAKHFDSRLIERVMQTNFMGMMHGIDAALPLLRESPRPHLVGMSSAVAFGPLPRAEVYGASKTAIRYALGGLRISLQPEKIPVTVICPGFVRTPLTGRNDFPMPCIVEPEDAARRIADGIARRAREIHFPARFTIPCRLLSLLPGPLYDRLIGKALRRS